ncbi:MAG: permease prefix domain 1-containing protein [Clostridiaceae bacterium]
MHEKLRKKVDELFVNAPNTKRASDLKEEIMGNLIDRYNDNIAFGKTEEEAINGAIAGVGDVDDLLRGLRENDVFNYEEMKKDRERSALFISVSVGLYIFSVVVLILTAGVFGVNGAIAVSLMFTIDAIATGLIIYNAISRPKYVKSDDTMVEDFKEWKSKSSDRNKILQSVKSITWSIIVAIYLFISFYFGIWAYSWIIFIIGAAIEKIIVLMFQLRE